MKFTTRDLIKAHYTPNQPTNEIWGLSVTKGDVWVTCSDDATIRFWSTSKKCQIKWAKLNIAANEDEIPFDKTGQIDDSCKGRSVDVSPDEKTVAVGCKDGTLRVIKNELSLPSRF